MADKPARALVIFGDGLLPAVSSEHKHLNDLAASGSCGFLALRSLTQPGSNLFPLENLTKYHKIYVVCVPNYIYF